MSQHGYGWARIGKKLKKDDAEFGHVFGHEKNESLQLLGSFRRNVRGPGEDFRRGIRTDKNNKSWARA